MIAILGLQDACLDSLARSISILIIIRGLMREVVGIKLTDIISPQVPDAFFALLGCPGSCPRHAPTTRCGWGGRGMERRCESSCRIYDNLRFACPLSQHTCKIFRNIWSLLRSYDMRVGYGWLYSIQFTD